MEANKKPSPAFAGEGWVRVFFLRSGERSKKKTLTLPTASRRVSSLSRESGRGLAGHPPWLASAASSSRATMLVILIIGFTAGPAVSL